MNKNITGNTPVVIGGNEYYQIILGKSPLSKSQQEVYLIQNVSTGVIEASTTVLPQAYDVVTSFTSALTENEMFKQSQEVMQPTGLDNADNVVAFDTKRLH